ncbi:hypothetical protein [Roseivirga sp. UBA1976]|uniref:hypothetical protein n=1 Tax=Roseivirga sp. UBA1976 TaxID=1947386 RepID=UPI00257CEFA6|nr:hypothetical protein [Roseivirga sp. UBA1976]|tara:strand:- start:8679 stop:9326 length:648 start_codon:yes stop_codon:yes gene_type:complete
MARRSNGVRDVLNWKFKYWDMPSEWAAHFGELPDQFNIYIDGDAGHGKTEYEMQMSKMMAQYFGKVHLFNFEQGKHNQITKSAQRNKFEDLLSTGKWMYARDIVTLDQVYDKLKRPNSGKLILLDSISFLELNYGEVRDLIKDFPRKNFACIAYKADFTKYKPIRHLFDIKIRVENFKAVVQSSRHGGGKEWIIWDKSADWKKGTLFEEKGGSNG